jgi:N-6 DNA Methylase
MAAESFRDFDFEWLDLVQPTGLVVAKTVLKNLGLVAGRQTQVQSSEMGQQLRANGELPALRDPWAFVTSILGWEPDLVVGLPGGPPVPGELIVRLPEHDTTLAPTWAVRELGPEDPPFQLLVGVENGVDLDKRGALGGWEATPHQRFERLLRETGVGAGLIIADRELRAVYAPKGETSGWLSFPITDLSAVAGRPLLAGLKLLLDRTRLFTDRREARLPALLRQSRLEQAAVSTALAEQVLGALHELLRGFDAADPALIRELAANQAHHLYEGLLTVLLRLVFVLYAEDRDLLPSLNDPHAKDVYEKSYSLRGLYAKLVEDAALHPDTMDERRGAWGRLLALFRLIHGGHRSHFVQARGGKLFDPDAFPFIEGRKTLADRPRVLEVSDGCLLRILEGLMTLRGEHGGPRERLSYRALDVEQIGSVYETVMGFTVETAAGRALAIKAGKHNSTPVFVDLDQLAVAKGKDRIKFLKEEADRGQLPASVAKGVEAAKNVVDLAAALDPIVDERASPKKHALHAATPILQPTDERRRTGSHYTPRSLTEPIVRHALEPAFERLGPNATPEEVLDLKVCDPAMGSGAFLAEACRALGGRLVEAWSRHRETKPVIPPDEDEDLHARRLIAQRCLYGVDKNPLATDLAKLSLWLATLARDHEFTFLDHALKSGDSLVGLTQAQIAAARWDESKLGLPLFRQLVKDRVAEALKGRVEIQVAPDDTARAVQEARHRSLEERIKEIRLIGDAVIGAFFAEDKPKAREKKRVEVESWLSGSPVAWGKLAGVAATLEQGAHPLAPFHWEIEFPEVFARENGGFDAIVGNPPFAGKNMIIAANIGGYLEFTQILDEGISTTIDLSAHFFRRAFSLLRRGGAFGLIATNTISQGDTRAGGLAYILKRGGTIFRATKRLKWPGEAAVTVSMVHIGKFSSSHAWLNGRLVTRISAFLVAGELDETPSKLESNIGRSYKGPVVLGMGFTFDDDEAAQRAFASPVALMHKLIKNDARNADVIRPYIGGEEVNRHPDLHYRRYVINFGDRSEQEARSGWPDLMKIVEEKVRPQRLKDNREARRKRWWQFGERQPGLFRAINGLAGVFVISEITPHLAIAYLPNGLVYAHTLKIFAIDRFSFFCVMQSRIHETWTRFFGSTFEDRIIYAPTDVFANFPLSADWTSHGQLEALGHSYHDQRAALMVARSEGMTKTYNRFHDRSETAEDIKRLRELHAAMDRAVLEAYGWRDLAARAEPIFLDKTNEDDHTYQGRLFWPSDFRDEVLARLLALNAQRHAEEVRLGIAPGMKGKAMADDEDDEVADE